MPEYSLVVLLMIAMAIPHIRGRRPLMMTSLTYTGVLGVMLYFSGASVGALIYTIAVLSSLAQVILPESGNPRMRYLRLGIASAAVIFGSAILYSSSIDLLVIAGFAIYRFCETRTKTLEIKIGYFAGTAAYMGYSALNGVWYVTLAQGVLLVSCMLALYLEQTGKPDVITALSRLVKPAKTPVAA